MWTNQLTWPHSQEFLSAPREIWFVDDNIAGYRQYAANLSMIAVNNAGHMVLFLFFEQFILSLCKLPVVFQFCIFCVLTADVYFSGSYGSTKECIGYVHQDLEQPNFWFSRSIRYESYLKNKKTPQDRFIIFSVLFFLAFSLFRSGKMPIW